MILYREDQQFREPWLWTLLIGGLALTVGIAVWLILWPVVPSDVNAPPVPLAPRALQATATLTFMLLIVGFFLFAKLQIEVTEQGLFVRFFPLHRKTRKIDLANAVSIEPVVYRPLLEYGGWGLRKTRTGTAYNVQGNEGVRIEFANGVHILLGTRKKEELAQAIRESMARHSSQH